MPKNQLFTRVNGPWVALLTLVLIVAVLSLAKAVLLPLALGVVLAFMLTPLVRLFDRWRFPRALGVTLTMILALGAVGGIGYVVFDQFSDLSTQVTKYTSSMRKKVAELRMGNDAALSQFTRTVDRVTEQLDANAADLRRAQPVRVVPRRMTPIERLRDVATSVFEPLASAVIVIVLVAFMLGQREDLRDRCIRLIGPDNVSLTTRLMDEAAHRVSQFLVWQTLINIGFGALVSLGLYWIGVPYAALWGGITAVLRFVPYVGSLLSAFMPATLAFATFPGWTEMLQTLALFAMLDLTTAYFIEPLVFGQRTGVSSFALLMSALFWIWVWGPIGLLLATPLTVCIAVLGRHVRSLRFLAIIFADEPALTPHVRFYQRLLARDEDEATVLIDRKRHELGVIGVMDHVLIPAVALVIQHRSHSEISDEDAQFILDETADVVQQMAPEEEAPAQNVERIVGISARTEVDHVVLAMLRTAMAPLRMEAIPAEVSADEAVGHAVSVKPALVCIVSISPTRGSEVRNYCRRLRAAIPEAKLLVLRPHLADADVSRSTARMKDAGADFVATSVAEAVEAIGNLYGASGKLTALSATNDVERNQVVAIAR
jgi:predicted PurR-regulated permease PerM